MGEPAYQNDSFDSQSQSAKQYKIRLDSGRELGPFDIERVKLFISKNRINGNEVAKIHPTGTWKDINQFPEIAELILLHLEGKLIVPEYKAQVPPLQSPIVESTAAIEQPIVVEQTSVIEQPAFTSQQQEAPQVQADSQGTLILTKDDEGTLMVEAPPSEGQNDQISQTPQDSQSPIVLELDSKPEIDFTKPSPELANERTLVFRAEKPSQIEETSNQVEKKNIINRIVKSRYFMIIAGLSVAGLLMEELIPTNGKQATNLTKEEIELAQFKVQLPVVEKNKIDSQQSELTVKSAFSFYNMDTVDGYKLSANLFSRAISFNPNNVSALCLLASSYINLVDVVNRDEKFFQIVTGLIGSASAKGIDLAELVIVEVELFNMLSNYDAAIERIVEYTKIKLREGQKLNVELFYYMALSYYLKGDTAEAISYLDKIPVESWFSVRIPYLYGLIYEKNGQLDQAVVAFEKVIQKSPNHLKARVHLAEVLIRKDNLAAAGTQADVVVNRKQFAAPFELARAYYIKARMLGSVSRNEEAFATIERAKKLMPDDIDILFEYYTIRARVGQSNGSETKKMIEVYELLAKGENALRQKDLDNAMAFFMAARTRDDKNVQPLLRISEVFRLQGDLYSSVLNYGKAIQLAPNRTDLYKNYIKSLIESFELKSAEEAIQKYISLNPPPAPEVIDYLYGLLNLKKENLKVAQAYLKRALQSASVDNAVYLNYADLLFKTEAFQDASFYYGLARRFDPLNIAAATGIAKSLVETQGLEKGVGYLQEQMQRTAQKAPVYLSLAEIYLRKGDLSQAMKAADNALREDPKYSMTYKVKGDILQAQDQLKQAWDSYQSYIVMNPNDPAPRLERYKIALKKNDLKAASSELMLVINSYPNYPGANYLIGDIALQEQRVDDAFLYAGKEIKSNPSFYQAYVLRGNALNLKREYVKALEDFNVALKMNQNFVPALIGAGYANHMLKTYSAAQTLLERAVTLDSANPQVRRAIGRLYYDMGSRDKAKLHLSAYLELLPEAGDKAEIQSLIQ